MWYTYSLGFNIYCFFLFGLQGSYRSELTLMVETGKRAEIEALYSHGFDFLGKYITRKIVQGDYI